MTTDPLSRARLLAGSRGLDCVITRVTVMEVPDGLAWVNPGELVFTTGYALRENLDLLPELIPALADRGVAALGVKPKRFLPEIPQELVAAADTHALPLLEIPFDLPWSDLLVGVTKAILMHQSRITRQKYERRDRFLEGWVTGGLDELDDIVKQAESVGIRLAPAYAVLAFRPRHGDWERVGGRSAQQRVREFIEPYLAGPQWGEHAVPTPRGLACLTVIEGGNPADLAARLRHRADTLLYTVRQRFPEWSLQAGLSVQLRPPELMPAAFQEAMAALEVAAAFELPEDLLVFEDIGLYRLLYALRGTPESQAFVDDILGPLLRHERRIAAELFSTLEIVLSGRTLGEAANALQVHYNTVRYRLERVRDLCGLDIENPEHRLRLQLAIKMQRLLNASGKPQPPAGQ